MGKYTLNDLTRILPPPENPVEIPTEDQWSRCTAEFADLPLDFREFLNCFGSGSIYDVGDELYPLLVIYSPFTNHQYTNMMKVCQGVAATIRGLGDDVPEPNFKACPQKNGYLPVGITGSGALLLWKTESDKDNWKITGWDETELYPYNVGWMDYLVMSIRQEMESDLSILMKEGTKLMFKPR